MDNAIIGTDGRLYFQYNKGMQFRLKQKNGEKHFFTIEDCQLIKGNQYYIIRRTGDDFTTKNSLARMKYWLSRQLLEVVAEGKAVEMPLLIDEVKIYYASKVSERKVLQSQIKEKLKGTDYTRLKSELKYIEVPLIFAEVAIEGDNPTASDIQKYEELKAKSDALTAQINKILTAVGITEEHFKRLEVCEDCEGYGVYDDGRICDCAKARAETIKRFVAAKRLARPAAVI